MTNNANLPAVPEARAASLHRATGETDIRLSLNLDGVGVYDVDTGNGFWTTWSARFPATA